MFVICLIRLFRSFFCLNGVFSFFLIFFLSLRWEFFLIENFAISLLFLFVASVVYVKWFNLFTFFSVAEIFFHLMNDGVIETIKHDQFGLVVRVFFCFVVDVVILFQFIKEDWYSSNHSLVLNICFCVGLPSVIRMLLLLLFIKKYPNGETLIVVKDQHIIIILLTANNLTVCSNNSQVLWRWISTEPNKNSFQKTQNNKTKSLIYRGIP